LVLSHRVVPTPPTCRDRRYRRRPGADGHAPDAGPPGLGDRSDARAGSAVAPARSRAGAATGRR